jgi:uncharacterized repeat protein (TIGR01451 family)
MQNLDFRLVNEDLEGPLWLRLTEENPESTLTLLSAAGTPVYSATLASGELGEERDWVITDTLTLHLGETSFFGSGQTIVISPVVTFGPAAVGTYDMRFSVDDDEEESEVQDADVFGRFTVLPEGCETALTEVTVSGPSTARTNRSYTFDATLAPLDASRPISYTWFPEPESGQGTPSATYNWPTAGEQFVGAIAENCAGFDADTRPVRVYTTDTPDLSLRKTAPPVALSGQEITYRLTISNSGALTATNAVVQDVLPVNTAYVSGGTLVGDTVEWAIPELAGYGGVSEKTLVVLANADPGTTITNDTYSAWADGGYNVNGTLTGTTRIVDEIVQLTPLLTDTLAFSGPEGTTVITLPAGSFFEPTTLAYEELDATANAASVRASATRRSFRLSAFQTSQLSSDVKTGESFSVTLSFSLASNGVSNSDGSEEKLQLYRWDSGRWSAEGITCLNEPEEDRVSCNVAPQALGKFALMEATNRVYLPLVLDRHQQAQGSARITDIARAGNDYQVFFETVGYTPKLPGKHVHFFFDTVPPDQAGVPGSGPWYAYGGPSPFTGYGITDRPPGATQICILVANPDHSVIQNTGNCYYLP